MEYFYTSICLVNTSGCLYVPDNSINMNMVYFENGFLAAGFFFVFFFFESSFGWITKVAKLTTSLRRRVNRNIANNKKSREVSLRFYYCENY